MQGLQAYTHIRAQTNMKPARVYSFQHTLIPHLEIKIQNFLMNQLPVLNIRKDRV